MSRNPKNGEEADLMTLQWDSGERGSIRTPVGLRAKISKFLKEVAIETGVTFSRNEFVLNAIRFYLRYLLQSTSNKDLVSRLQEEFKSFDNGFEPPIESSLEDTNGDSKVRESSGADCKPECD